MNDKKIIEAEARKQGLKTCDDPDALRIVKSAFAQVKQVFPDELKRTPICSFMVYIQDEQTVESFRLSDGICFYGRNDKEEKTLFAIAIASNALQHGLSYLHFLLLHELTHALVQGVQEKGPGSLPHDELFEAQLNELIDEFNRQMGADLSNDYSQYGDY